MKGCLHKCGQQAWTKLQQFSLQVAGLSSQGIDATQLHTKFLPGPTVTTTPYQDGEQRVRVVGWQDANKVAHPAWVAVTRFADGWPPEFYWLDKMASEGAPIGALFQLWGFPPLQNRLLSITVPAEAIPQWVRTELGRSDRSWTIEVYNFCAEVRGRLYEYGLLCEFRPSEHSLPPRSCLGLFDVWKHFKRYDQVVTYLKRTNRPTRWDYPIMWLARLAALPTALRAVHSARNVF